MFSGGTEIPLMRNIMINLYLTVVSSDAYDDHVVLYINSTPFYYHYVSFYHIMKECHKRRNKPLTFAETALSVTSKQMYHALVKMFT